MMGRWFCVVSVVYLLVASSILYSRLPSDFKTNSSHRFLFILLFLCLALSVSFVLLLLLLSPSLSLLFPCLTFPIPHPCPLLQSHLPLSIRLSNRATHANPALTPGLLTGKLKLHGPLGAPRGQAHWAWSLVEVSSHDQEQGGLVLPLGTMSAALAAGIAAALMSLVTGVICAFLAVLHHARLIRSGCGIPNTELRHNALRQPLRLALHHLELSAEAMCPPMTVNTLPVPRNRKARSLGPLLVLFLPLALAQLVVVAVLAVTCGTAASAAQRAARRGAAALVNAQTGHPGAGFMVILHSAVATLAFALATPVLLPGLPAAHTAAFSPVWLCQRPDESAFEAVSPAATSRAASPSSASLHASTSLHMVGHSDVSNAVRVVSRQATRLESRESGTAGRSSPARLPSAPMSRSAWSPVSRLSPVPPVSPVSSITDTAQQAWSAPSSPTPRLTSVSVASLPPSGAEPLRLASAASTSTAPNRLPSLRSSEEMAAAAAIDVPMPLSTPRGSPPSHLPRSMLSAPDKGLPIVYKPRSLTLVHARLLSEALDTSFGSVSNRSEMAAHVALWAAEQEPGAMVPLAPSIGAYFLRLLVGYASLAQMASSPGEAGACVVAAFMPALLLALLWCILLPLLPLALLLPSCLPFSRLRALLLQRGTTWFVVQLQPWLCLLALIHAYARLSEAEITLLLRWVSLLAWAIVAALLLLLSRHMCVSVRWFLGWFWACNLMTTALLLTAVVGEVDRSLKLGAADPVARGALSVHVAIAAYVAVSGLILRGTKRRTLGIVLPVAAQVLAPTTALASDECGLAVACRASALGPAGTLVELRAAHAFAPATNRSMSLAQFLLGEVSSTTRKAWNESAAVGDD